MSMSQSIDPQATGDLDLYDDILAEDFACEKKSLDELHQKYQEAVQKITTLETTVKERTVAMEILEKKNTNLQKNISMLYKTACMEIKRKNDNINSLREQLDSHEKENYLKQRQSGYSKWNGDYQRNNKPAQIDQRDTKQSEKNYSNHSDVKNTKCSDQSNCQRSSSRERRHDDQRQDERKHDDLRQDERKQDERKHDDLRQDERKQDERKHDDLRQDERKHDDQRQDERKHDDLRQDERRQDDLRHDDLRQDDLRQDERKHDDLRQDDQRQDERKHDERRQDERKHDERKHDERKHDEQRHDERRHDERRHDDQKHDERRHDGQRHDEQKHDDRRHDDRRYDDRRHDNRRHDNRRHDNRRHDNRKHREKPSRHRDLQKSEAKDSRSLERKSSRHSKNKTNSSSIKMENSSSEHKQKGTEQNHCQKSPSSTQKLSSFSSVQTKSHTSPLKDQHSVPDDPNEFGNAKRQDSKLIDCQQSVEPVSISAPPLAKSARSDVVESTKPPAGKLPASDKPHSKMCDPVVASLEVTTKHDRNLSPVVSQTCKTSEALNSQEPIVIECFGTSNLEDSHSPVIIRCFSNSVTNSDPPKSINSKDSDCDDSTPKKKIVRKLFLPIKPDYDVLIENQNEDDLEAKNHSLEFLNEMKKRLSQEIAAHNKRQQDEDCADTTQLDDIYQNHKDEYCSNDSVREDENSLKTYSPQPQRDLPVTTQQSEADCVGLEIGEIISDEDDDDVGKGETFKDKFSPLQIYVNSNSQKTLKHSTKNGSKHSWRQPSKKRNMSGNETLSKIINKQNSCASRHKNKKRRVDR